MKFINQIYYQIQLVIKYILYINSSKLFKNLFKLPFNAINQVSSILKPLSKSDKPVLNVRSR